MWIRYEEILATTGPLLEKKKLRSQTVPNAGSLKKSNKIVVLSSQLNRPRNELGRVQNIISFSVQIGESSEESNYNYQSTGKQPMIRVCRRGPVWCDNSSRKALAAIQQPELNTQNPTEGEKQSCKDPLTSSHGPWHAHV